MKRVPIYKWCIKRSLLKTTVKSYTKELDLPYSAWQFLPLCICTLIKNLNMVEYAMLKITNFYAERKNEETLYVCKYCTLHQNLQFFNVVLGKGDIYFF
jgi:hypothetical protein